MPTLRHPQPDFTGVVRLFGTQTAEFVDGTADVEGPIIGYLNAGCSIVHTTETDLGETVGLEDLTIPELKALAKEDGIDLAGATLKDDIIATIVTAEPDADNN